MRSLHSLSVLVLTGCLLPGLAVPAMAQDEDAGVGVRVIELEADTALRFTQDGEQVFDIPVVPGDTVVFRIDNTAGFLHDFYIGTEAELMVPYATTEVGIPEWQQGTRELVWEVPDDVNGLRFGCTVPGHYSLMQGCFSEARVGPDGTVERVAEAEACLLAGVDPFAGLADEWRPGGRVEVPWAGIAITFPDDWDISVDPDPDPIGTSGAMLVLSAFDGSLLGASACFVMAHDGSDLDWDTALALSDAVIELGEARALRFDGVSLMGNLTSYGSTFLIGQPGRLFTLECDSDEGLQDGWLSIAESFEFLPEE